MKIDFSSKVLVAYITAGVPNFEFTQKAILKLQECGVSAIEIGVPYSDPVADGNTIAEASMIALERGVNIDLIFDAVSEIKSSLKIPLYFMSYYSPIYTYGIDKTIDRAKNSGVSGFIIPDVSLNQGKAIFKKIKNNGLDPILLAFPNTPDAQLKKISAISGSFVYYVNLFGTTGMRDSTPQESIDRLRKVKQIVNGKVCAGFGVSNKVMFDNLLAEADGVIIGSAIIKHIINNLNNPQKALDEIEIFIKDILE